VFAETCPQYLLLLAENMRPKPHAGGCGCGSSVPLRPDNYISEEEDGYEGAKLICSPPLRESKSDLDAVWKGVRNGTVTTISSDHAPGRYDHPMGKKKGKVGGLDFTKTPNGLPGLETRLPLMMTYGVGQQKSEYPSHRLAALGSHRMADGCVFFITSLDPTVGRDMLHATCTVVRTSRAQGIHCAWT
jgi:dihydropyrimidinase